MTQNPAKRCCLNLVSRAKPPRTIGRKTTMNPEELKSTPDPVFAKPCSGVAGRAGPSHQGLTLAETRIDAAGELDAYQVARTRRARACPGLHRRHTFDLAGVTQLRSTYC